MQTRIYSTSFCIKYNSYNKVEILGMPLSKNELSENFAEFWEIKTLETVKIGRDGFNHFHHQYFKHFCCSLKRIQKRCKYGNSICIIRTLHNFYTGWGGGDHTALNKRETLVRV